MPLLSGEYYLIVIFLYMDKKSTEEKTIPKTIEEIAKEAKRIEESTLYSSKGHFSAAGYWNSFHYFLGIPSVVLSAIAGASAFSQLDKSNYIVGIISLLVSVLSALMTFINPNDKSKTHLEAGNKYDALNSKTRIFRTVDCSSGQSELTLTEQLRIISKEKTKLNTAYPKIPWFAYQQAKKGIENGEATFVVDGESK